MYAVKEEEEEYDHRSLYERLKSQKDKAEADKAEQFKFSEYIMLVITLWQLQCMANATVL